jgi:hypothetical protein
MGQLLLILLCCGIGFMAGYGVRAMISLHRRHEERRKFQERLERRKEDKLGLRV